MPVNRFNINHLLINVLQYLKNQYTGFEVSLNEHEALEEKQKFISNCMLFIEQGWSERFENSLDKEDEFFYSVLKPLVNNPKENFYNNPNLKEEANTFTVIFVQHKLFKNIFEACRQNTQLLTDRKQIEWFEKTHQSLFEQLEAIKNKIPIITYLNKPILREMELINAHAALNNQSLNNLAQEKHLLIVIVAIQLIIKFVDPASDTKKLMASLQLLLLIVTTVILVSRLLRDRYADTFFKAAPFLNQAEIVHSDEIKKFFMVEAHELEAFKKELELSFNNEGESIALHNR